MAKGTNGMEGIAEELWKSPTGSNWEKFSKVLPKSGLKYYRVVYQKKKLQKAEDLTKSYAELYDSKQKLVVKIPIFERKGAKAVGATHYLKGLLTINKVDEWIR